MFHFGKKKKEETGNTQGLYNTGAIPGRVNAPRMSAPTAEQMFETTMAPTHSPQEFMQRNASVPGEMEEKTEHTDSLQYFGQTGDLSQMVDPVDLQKNTRVLKFVGNNGGALFYHSRMEESDVSSTIQLDKQDEVWICSCGTHNYATFCAQCGRPKSSMK